MTPIFCLLRLNSDATLSAGDAVPVIVDSGTSGHGVTVASGVVTLPSAYQWFAQTQIVPTSIISVDFDWYVGSTASTTFAQTGVSLVNSTTSGSNNIGYAYFDVAMSTKNIELRASVACTVDASFTWLMLTGYPS
tara:strand:- start:3331 stop:3735 length:405 start_codon:yes stop_codon:yes gene_type:complete